MKQGEYWYPVQLIQPNGTCTKWKVRWWKHCEFKDSGIKPDSITSIATTDIVDALWMDRTSQRKVHVSTLNGFMVQYE